MIEAPKSKPPEKEDSTRCAQKRLGYCPASCNILKIGVNKIRWQGWNPEETKNYLQKELCPSGCRPQIEKTRNTRASCGFGQPRKENWTGLQNIIKGN